WPSRQSASSASYCTPRISPSTAIVFAHLVIADSLASENPMPRAPSPALLLYAMLKDGSMPARPGGATSGMEITASPVLVTEKELASVPATTVSGASERAAAANTACCGTHAIGAVDVK